MKRHLKIQNFGVLGFWGFGVVEAEERQANSQIRSRTNLMPTSKNELKVSTEKFKDLLELMLDLIKNWFKNHICILIRLKMNSQRKMLTSRK